ncbi:TOMM system kinase/cyclase fusion protein [Chitinophaga jiangningensis]|uniref:TOMM system kinase/cyclase fusion protein n=2 Tax=Chitinophaga jiangningensis TaxID=1419482 RepID=A0A1M7IMU8_9BACT|nr:TOMM system kinase/cyclase fusion protein [Chitinophaga jiangningensis]
MLTAGFPVVSNYELLEAAGEGATCHVYKAIQQHTRQLVALKVLKPVLSQSIQLNRFEREAKVCAGISHPYIVKLLDKGTTADGAPFVAFEFLEGLTLRQQLQRSGALSVAETQALMGQLLDALCCAHANGVAHRDLKPDNIIIIRSGARPHVKILDFGISTFVQDIQHTDAMGTPAYCAPEQLRGEPPTTRADLYAWGLILIECLTGCAAIQGNSIPDIYYQQLGPDPIPIPAFLKSHPIHDLLQAVLAKHPGDRLSNVHTLFERFQQLDLSTLQPQLASTELLQNSSNATQDNSLAWMYEKKEKRQITILCGSVRLLQTPDATADEDILEEIQKAQLTACIDIATRSGGFLKGVFADQFMIYFGYPTSEGNAAYLAGKAAFEILTATDARSKRLQRQYGLQLETRISIHTGSVICRPQRIPEGTAPNYAYRQLSYAANQRIVVSVATKQLLSHLAVFERPLHLPEEFADVSYMVKERRGSAFARLREGQHKGLYGRTKALQVIQQAWESNGAMLLIRGVAGMGKSRLIYEASRAAGNELIEVRCMPEYRHRDLYIIFSVLQQHYGFRADLPPETNLALLSDMLEVAELDKVTVMPILLSCLGMAFTAEFQPSLLSPGAQRRQLVHALIQCLTHISLEKKYLVIIEDLHWIDSGSAVVLQEIAERQLCKSMLLLLSARPAFEWRWEGCDLLELDPLDHAASTDLIHELLQDKGADQECIQYLLQHTDGIPFFIEELTRYLLAKELLVYDGIRYRFADSMLPLTVPLTLNEILIARLDVLGNARETAQLAACVGREVSWQLLRQISSLEEEMLQQHLQMLEAQDIIYRLHTEKGLVYVFRHALICEVAYQSLLLNMRRRIHARIAGVLLEEENPNDPHHAATIARHLYHAGNCMEAVDWQIKSVQLMLGGITGKESLVLCQQALKWLYTLPEEAIRTQKEVMVRHLMLSVLVVLESYGAPAVKEQLDILMALYQCREANEEILPAMLMYCNYYAMTGNWKQATATAQHLHTVAHSTKNLKYSIVSSVFLGLQYFNNGELRNAAAMMEEALALYDPALHSSLAYEFGLDQEALASSTLACVYTLAGEESKAETMIKRAIEKVEAIAHPHTTASTWLGLACVYFYQRNRKQVNHYSTALLQVNESSQLHMFGNYGAMLQAWANHDLAAAKAALEKEAQKGIQSMNSFWNAVVAEIEMHVNEQEAALQRLTASLLLIGEADGALYHAEIHRLLAVLHAGKNNDALAATHLKTASDIANAQQAVLIRQRIHADMNHAL